MTAKRRPIVAGAIAIAVLASGCGTAARSVELVDPAPTLFAERAGVGGVDPTSSTPSGDPDNPRLTLESLLPPPRLGGLGVIETAGVGVPVVATTAEGWVVATPCGSVVELADVSPRTGLLVMLDPGHGGDDSGAAGAGVELSEADLNLAVALATAAELISLGIPTMLTRTRDVELSAEARAALVDPSGALVFISIHHRGDDGPISAEPASEVFHQVDSADSRRLAGLVSEELTAALTVDGVEWAAPSEPGVKYLLNQRGSDYFTVLRETPVAASVLVEVGSLATSSGAALLASADGQRSETNALSAAVVRYLVTADAGAGYVEPVQRVRQAPSSDGAKGCTDPVAPPPTGG